MCQKVHVEICTRVEAFSLLQGPPHHRIPPQSQSEMYTRVEALPLLEEPRHRYVPPHCRSEKPIPVLVRSLSPLTRATSVACPTTLDHIGHGSCLCMGRVTLNRTRELHFTSLTFLPSPSLSRRAPRVAGPDGAKLKLCPVWMVGGTCCPRVGGA